MDDAYGHWNTSRWSRPERVRRKGMAHGTLLQVQELESCLVISKYVNGLLNCCLSCEKRIDACLWIARKGVLRLQNAPGVSCDRRTDLGKGSQLTLSDALRHLRPR
jgi:hypothetical protein